MVAAVRALEALAHERTVAKLKLQTEDTLTALDEPLYKLPYDPASIFLLETMVSIAIHAPQYIEDLWYASAMCHAADLLTRSQAHYFRTSISCAFLFVAIQHSPR